MEGLEVKPGDFRRSSTLPCFKVLAGLKGPENSSLVSAFAVLFTARVMDEAAAASLDIARPVFMTGALKVKPEDGENDGGLAAVALTIGEAKVKGTEGGEEGAGGSFLVSVSRGARADFVVAGMGVVVVVAGEKLKVGSGRVQMGREMAGRSGTFATSSSGRLVEGLTARSRFILPPPEPALLTAGVLDRG